MADKNRYVQLIEDIFFKHHKPGMTEFEFVREEIESSAKKLKIKLPKNQGDLIYSFRYRVELPESITRLCPAGKSWIIRPAGRARYQFVAATVTTITPNPRLAAIKVPDATPGIIERYALNDEQALLAKLRYNRLIDIFTGVACYSLQNHLRTTVAGMGQIETDEMYIGVDKQGAHHVFPVQAKGGRDRINTVQIDQDMRMCREKFPDLLCRALAAQFIGPDLIALFEFGLEKRKGENEIVIVDERHYRLVSADDLTPEEIRQYASQSLSRK